MAKITMFASDFSKYGSIQEMKSTLGFLAADAGHKFIFINDPLRIPNNVKVKFGDKDTYTGSPMSAKELNKAIASLENIHA